MSVLDDAALAALSRERERAESLRAHVEAIIPDMRAWLGHDGITFFRAVVDNYGAIATAMWILGEGPGEEHLRSGPNPSQRGVPHPVHFREGMQIRNWLRTRIDGWDLDEVWAPIVHLAIER